MKKFLKIGGMLAGVIGLIVLVGAVVTFAQDDPAPTVPDSGVWQCGAQGRFGQRGGGLIAQYMDRDAMHAAIADALGLTVEELAAARAEGKSVRQLAAEQGVELEAIWAAMQEVRETAVQQALEDGVITEEQAEQLLNHERPFRSFGGRGFRGGAGDPHGPMGNGGPFGQGMGRSG